MMDEIIKKDKNEKEILKYEIIIKGAIFCQVNKIKQFIQDNPSITEGIQKWRGAEPNFIIITINVIFLIIKILILIISCKIINIKIDIRNKEEAIAWTKKYFNEASDVKIFLFLIMIGMKDSKFNSNPNHIAIHEFLEIQIIVPKNNGIKRKIFLFKLK